MQLPKTSQGLFYFQVADPPPMSAIFPAYNDWPAEFCRTDPARLKGIAMINLDDVQDGIKELERAARLGLAGAMITEYPLEHRRYDQSEYEPKRDSNPQSPVARRGQAPRRQIFRKRHGATG